MTKILFVDDEPDIEPLICQRFRSQIRSGEIEFLFAQDGFQAISILDSVSNVDLVVTDINMPRMDGLTLLSRLSDRVFFDAKVIIVSAYGDISNIRAGMNRGAFDFVTKPISFEDLELTMKRALGRVQAEREARDVHLRLLQNQKEFELARRVQLGILPSAWPSGQAEAFVGFMRPAREVGGDAYNYFPIDDDHIGFTIADVAGKGVGAALVAAITHALLRAVAVSILDPGECLVKVNRLLTGYNPELLFVTMVYCILNRRTGILSFVNAGHPWPLKLDGKGGVVPLSGTRGIPVGILDVAEWSTNTIKLQPGERLVLFTDGVTEATCGSGDFFGEHFLLECLQSLSQLPSDALITQLIAQIDGFVGIEPQSDDITCLVLDWIGGVSVNEPLVSSRGAIEK